MLCRGMGMAAEITKVAPRATCIMPRVVMKADSPTRVTKKPVMKPQPVPTATPMAEASQMFILALKNSEPVTTPTKATTEPTDRSMPPLISTRVMPMATKPLMANSMNRLRKLSPVRKYGDNRLMTKPSTTMITIVVPSRKP